MHTYIHTHRRRTTVCNIAVQMANGGEGEGGDQGGGNSNHTVRDTFASATPGAVDSTHVRYMQYPNIAGAGCYPRFSWLPWPSREPEWPLSRAVIVGRREVLRHGRGETDRIVNMMSDCAALILTPRDGVNK